MKRIITAFLLLSLLFAISAFAAPDVVDVENADEITQEAAKEETASLAATEYTDGYFTYTVSNGEATITDCDTSISGDVVIPDTLGGYLVTSINGSAFRDCTKIKRIVVPNSVTSIGAWAFYNCNNLEEMTLPFVGAKRGNSKRYNAVFGYIFGYTNSPAETGTTLQYYELSESHNYYYYIPKSIRKVIITDETIISDRAFENCSNFTNIEISNGVTRIGERAFHKCTSLTSIEIPGSVSRIDEGAFYKCSNLQEITLPFVGSQRVNSGTYDSVFGYIFGYTSSSSSSGIICQSYSSDLSYYYYIPSSLEKVTITDETVIPYGAFYNCLNIKNIVINDGVIRIDPYAFYNCMYLESIVIPDRIISIEKFAFDCCTNLDIIYFGGTSSNFKNISVHEYNDCFEFANVIYNKYSISFNANGGIGEPTTQIKIRDKDATISTTIPNRTGYQFLYWLTGTSEGEIYNPGSSYSNNADLVLYAIWKPNTYRIIFDAKGGTVSPESKTVNYNSTFGTLPVPEKEGRIFLGWFETDSGQVSNPIKINSETLFTSLSDITLYAHWKYKTYIISYNANGGESAPEEQTKTHSVGINVSLEVPTRTGYDFLGWSTSANGNVEYEAGASFTTEADTTLYAVWQLKTYSVTYNANGGENAPEMQTKKHFEDLVLSSDVPTRTGYDFLGWSTSANGNVEYEAGANFTTEAETTLYAVWRLKTYSITYNTNGGENEIENQIKKHFEDLIISEDVPINTGYAFLGWSTTRNGKVEYNPGDVYTKNEALELYAVWQINTYLVTYDANGGENAPETQTKKHFEDLVLSSDEPTRTGYNFLGWSTSSNGNVEYEAGAIFLNESDTILFAVWEIKLYDIKYDATGGESAPNTQIKKYFDSLVLSKNMPTKKGCVFLGWSTTPSGEVEYAPGAIFDKNEDTTLYAVWFINASGNCGFNLKWKMYGTKLTITGTGSMANWSESTLVPWSAYKDEIETVVISDGVTSIGSYAFSDCENLKTVTFTESVTKINSYAFYNASSIETINFTGSLGDLESIEISGYNDSFMNGSFNFDYVITYTITYNTLGGMSDIQEQSKKHGEPITLSTEVPTRIGHAFLGWSVEQSGEIVYNAGDEYTENADIVLYAVWEEVKGDVSGDGELTQEDMDIIIEAMLGKELTDEEFKYANVYDEDDVINIKDLIALAQMLSQSQNA